MKTMNADDLFKAFSGLAGHFKKAADHHMEMCKAHEGYAAFHKGQADYHQGHADGMDGDDQNKAAASQHALFHKSAHEFHKAISFMHKAHADHCQGCADALAGTDKAMAVEIPNSAAVATGDDATKVIATDSDGKVIEMTKHDLDLGKSTTEVMVKAISEAVATLGDNPDFKKLLAQRVFERAEEIVKNQLKPTNVSATAPSAPADAHRVVARDEGINKAGVSTIDTPDLEKEAAKLSPELRRAVGL